MSVENEHLGQIKYLDHPAEKPQPVHSTLSHQHIYGPLTISLHNPGQILCARREAFKAHHLSTTERELPVSIVLLSSAAGLSTRGGSGKACSDVMEHLACENKKIHSS